jgi:hypothetical protein
MNVVVQVVPGDVVVIGVGHPMVVYVMAVGIRIFVRGAESRLVHLIGVPLHAFEFLLAYLDYSVKARPGAMRSGRLCHF